MTTPIDPSSIVVRETTPRMTPPPVTRQFREVLVQGGRAIINGAVAAAAYVPGGNLLAAAVRGAGLPTLGGSGSAASNHGGTVEGPPQSLEYSIGGNDTTLGGGSTTGGSSIQGAGSSGGGVSQDDVLARGQEMSMRMLRLQEAMGEENRRYTALSNVLHARHEMAKTAIGNIR